MEPGNDSYFELINCTFDVGREGVASFLVHLHGAHIVYNKYNYSFSVIYGYCFKK